MKRSSTRLLLTCAAVGVACALAFIPTVSFGTVILATVPWLYGLVAGCYLLPGVVVQALFRRGGLALLTATIGGLVTAVFVPGGLAYVPVFALVGALQEIPFAVSAYRYWRTWVFFLTAAVFGLVVGAATFAGFIGQTSIGAAEVLHALSFMVGFTLFTILGVRIAAGVERTGVARGIQKDVDRRRRTNPADEAATVGV